MDTLTRQTLSQTIIPPIYSSKAPFIIPKNHLPKRCTSPLTFNLLRWHLSLNSKPPGGVTHFSLGLSHGHIRYTC